MKGERVKMPLETVKRITVDLSYQVDGHSFYAELHELDKQAASELGEAAVNTLETACKARLEGIKEAEASKKSQV